MPATIPCANDQRRIQSQQEPNCPLTAPLSAVLTLPVPRVPRCENSHYLKKPTIKALSIQTNQKELRKALGSCQITSPPPPLPPQICSHSSGISTAQGPFPIGTLCEAAHFGWERGFKHCERTQLLCARQRFCQRTFISHGVYEQRQSQKTSLLSLYSYFHLE